MPAYSSAVGATTTGEWSITSANPGELKLTSVRWMIETAGATVRHDDLLRQTGGTTPTNRTPELANTRSAAAGNTFAAVWVTNPTEVSGNAFIFVAAGEDSERRGEWKAPRPWAKYCAINGEMIGVGAVTITNGGTATFLYDIEQKAGRPYRRRGTRRGLWHWAAHRNDRAGGLNQAVRCPTTCGYVAYTRILPPWRLTNTLEVQLTTLPPTAYPPRILAQRFPMPEVYQRLATVSNNFGQVAFPLLGAWQPGTMDSPLVRAQWILQAVRQVPIVINPIPALIPRPQQLQTIQALSNAFYQIHAQRVTNPTPPTSNAALMTWYWP